MRFVSMEQARPQATVLDACGLTACEAENDLKHAARNSGADLAGCCRRWMSYDAVADLMAARRSSIRSCSTSQYLSAESSSLSG